MLLLLSRFSHVRLCATVMSDSVRPHRWQPTRLPRPWDSPGTNTGVGCHFLLQCMKVKSESEVSQSCPTLSEPMDCSLPGSSVHGIFQARVLEWGAIAFSAIKKNTFESVLMRQMKLEPIIQSEVSQKEKHQYSILMHIYRFQKDGNDDSICETAKETQMQRTDFWTPWEKGSEMI